MASHPDSFARLAMEAAMVLIPMILSLSVHECAHAAMARRLGDPTAEQMGRLTLNPLAHIDPFGTVLLPFSMLVLSGMGAAGRLPLFGFAKPTPVNPNRFARHISVRRGSFWVAAAGPLSNLGLAFVCALILSIVAHDVMHAGSMPEALQQLSMQMMSINLSLCVFNLIPLAPLDGQAVVSNALSPARAAAFERFNVRYGNYALWGIIIFGRRLIVVPIRLLADGMLRLVGL